jgi:hypothetical protein
MLITPEILEVMEFSKTPDGYEMRLHGYRFTIKKDELYNTWSFSAGDIIHSVDSVEEMIAFAMGDGYDSGYKQCKKDIRKFLEYED